MDEPQANANGGGNYTEAAAYKGFQPPEEHTLPSGSVFLLRKPQIMKMMRKGQIPNPLMEIVNRVFQERDTRDLTAEAAIKGVTVPELEEQIREETANDEAEHPPVPTAESALDEITADEGLAFMDVIVWASIVRPAVEMAPMDGDSPLTVNGNLSYDALSDEDIQYIMGWATKETAEAERFPGNLGRESGGGDRREVRAEAVGSVGDPV